jgi:flagellar motor switch protein FliM
MMLSVTGREDNPAMMQMFSPNDVVLQFVFQVGFNGNFGEFQVTIPYGLLESIREKLGPDVPKEDGQDHEKWRQAIALDLGVATVAVSTSIDNLSITLQELIELAPGDVLPIDIPEVDNLTIQGDAKLTFLASANEYFIDNVLFTNNAEAGGRFYR